MRKIAYIPFFIASFYLVLALLYGPQDLRVVPVQITPQQNSKYYNYKGVLNVHSQSSTGSGSIDDIGQAAQDAELDFVVVTDLNQFDFPEDRETYYGKSLVMLEGEYTYLDSRLLYMNFEDMEGLQGLGRSQLVFSDLLSSEDKEDSGFFVLAHPLKDGYQWSGELPVGLTGIEIYNLRYLWQRTWQEKRSSFLWALLLYPVNTQWSFARLFASYTHPEIAYWERHGKDRKLFGYAGADAESRARMPGGEYWNIPSYTSMFSVLRNHVLTKSELTGNPKEDRQKLMEALRSGNFYLGFDLIGDTSGFEMELMTKQGKSLPMGTSVAADQAGQVLVNLRVLPNVPFEIRILKDGNSVLQSSSQNVVMDVHEPGVYRAVVRVKLDFPFPDQDRWLTWITSNPIYVR